MKFKVLFFLFNNSTRFQQDIDDKNPFSAFTWTYFKLIFLNLKISLNKIFSIKKFLWTKFSWKKFFKKKMSQIKFSFKNRSFGKICCLPARRRKLFKSVHILNSKQRVLPTLDLRKYIQYLSEKWSR